MKLERLVLACLVAPLMAFPMTAGGELVQGALFPASGSMSALLQGSLDSGLRALIPAYGMMIFLGIPLIFFLRQLGAFRPRPLEITSALLGGLPFLPWAVRALLELPDQTPFDGQRVLTPMIWLLVGTLSGLFAGRAIWLLAGEPLPQVDHGAAIHRHLPADAPRETVDSDFGALPAENAALTVLYDVPCALCCRARYWLAEQPKYVPMAFVAAGSNEARRRFPGLDHDATLEELTVVGWGGEVYKGANAWVMCLWALKRYRSAALRLSEPEMPPVARRLIAWVSRNRFQIGETAGWTK